LLIDFSIKLFIIIPISLNIVKIYFYNFQKIFSLMPSPRLPLKGLLLSALIANIN
jgi:hypothetical protein